MDQDENQRLHLKKMKEEEATRSRLTAKLKCHASIFCICSHTFLCSSCMAALLASLTSSLPAP